MSAKSLHPEPPADEPERHAVLTDAEEDAWRGFLRFNEVVLSNISREMVASTSLSVPEFQVMIRLHEYDEGPFEQRELMRQLGWSQSRLSHLLTRMAARGLIERRSLGAGRLMAVDLTPPGRETMDAAMEVQAVVVRRYFFGAGTPDGPNPTELAAAMAFFARFAPGGAFRWPSVPQVFRTEE